MRSPDVHIKTEKSGARIITSGTRTVAEVGLNDGRWSFSTITFDVYAEHHSTPILAYIPVTALEIPRVGHWKTTRRIFRTSAKAAGNFIKEMELCG